MRFLEDIALIFDGTDPATAASYRSDRSVTAHAALIHLRDMETAWNSIADGRYVLRQKVISRWGNYRDGGASMRVCFDGPSGEWCSPSMFSQQWWVGGSRMTDSRPAYAEANTERDRLLAIDKAAPAGTSPFIYAGHLYTTPLAGGHCPVGWFDGANCYVATPEAGTSPFIYAGGLYTTPVRTPTCPIGSFDGANCYVHTPEAGTEAFIHAGGLYTTAVYTPSCPTGSYDGANCFVASIPAGTEGFVYASGLYTTPIRR